MTKPAVDVESFLPGVLYERYYRDGTLLTETNKIVRQRHFVDFKPANVNNLVRPDGTRPPASWQRKGGSMNGVRGTYITQTVVPPNTYKRVWEGQLAAPGLVPGSITRITPDGEISAIRQALGRLGEAEVQLGAAMREARSTSEMVGKYYRHAATLTYKMESAVKGSRRVRDQFREFLQNGWKDVPSAYLEYLFGMKPLADDLTNAVQVLQDNKQHGGSFHLTLRGSHRTSNVTRDNAYQSWQPYVSSVKGDIAVTQISRASLVFQLPDWYWDRLPPVTFFRENWETARLSFVLDWVLPINSWLAGFEGNQLRPFFREGSRVTLLNRRLSGCFVTDPNWVSREVAGGSDYFYQRAVITSFPTGELFSLPRFRNILGLDQLRVGSALLGQRIASLGRAIGK